MKRRASGRSMTRREFLGDTAFSGVALGAGLGLAGWARTAEAQSPVTIVVRTFAGVYNEATKDAALPLFQKAYPQVNVRLEVETIAQRYPKILASRSRPLESAGMYNDQYSARGAMDDLFVKFNEGFIPNLKDSIKSVQPANGFGVALTIQPFGISYNPKYAKKPESWLDLFDPRYAGRVGMLDSFPDAFIMVARILGKDERSIEAAVDEWAKHKKNIALWTNSFTVLHEALDKGEIWFAPDWGGTALGDKKKGLSIEFSWPKEGVTQATLIAHVLKGWSPEVTEYSQRFINSWLEPEAQAALLTKAGLSPTNRKVSIPRELAQLDNIITPEKAAQLVRYDYEYLAKILTQFQELINRKLR